MAAYLNNIRGNNKDNMVVKAYKQMMNCQKKGSSVSAETPQSSRAKAPFQALQQDPQDDPQDTKVLALADVATYAASTLGLLSGNKVVTTTVTTPKSNDDGDKKMPTVGTPVKLKDPPDQQGMINMAPNQNVTVRVIPMQPDTAKDGLGTPWMSRVFGEGTPFSAAQSDIQFTNQTDTKYTSKSAGYYIILSHYKYLTRGTTQQEDILLAGMNDLEDDPWEIIMFQMDEAISNIGAA